MDMDGSIIDVSFLSDVDTVRVKHDVDVFIFL